MTLFLDSHPLEIPCFKSGLAKVNTTDELEIESRTKMRYVEKEIRAKEIGERSGSAPRRAWWLRRGRERERKEGRSQRDRRVDREERKSPTHSLIIRKPIIVTHHFFLWFLLSSAERPRCCCCRDGKEVRSRTREVSSEDLGRCSVVELRGWRLRLRRDVGREIEC